MRATMFFAVLREARRLYQQEKNLFLSDLCDVATVTWGTAKNFEMMKKHFVHRGFPGRRKSAMDASSPATAQIVSAAFRAVAHAMPGGIH